MKYLPSITLTLLSMALPAQSSDGPSQSVANAQRQKPAQIQTNEGDVLFATHCARCHTPPMTLSQRTTGTIIMHMRVRARLSAHDEKQLLRYLAP